jgi:Reverse transcriptase (RNA-dependent DNA polymerase)
MGTWEEIMRKKVKSDKRVLGGTWVFKRKRAPDGKGIKHKARYCVQGDQQVAGADYFESHLSLCGLPCIL